MKWEALQLQCEDRNTKAPLGWKGQPFGLFTYTQTLTFRRVFSPSFFSLGWYLILCLQPKWTLLTTSVVSSSAQYRQAFLQHEISHFEFIYLFIFVISFQWGFQTRESRWSITDPWGLPEVCWADYLLHRWQKHMEKQAPPLPSLSKLEDLPPVVMHTVGGMEILKVSQVELSGWGTLNR